MAYNWLMWMTYSRRNIFWGRRIWPGILLHLFKLQMRLNKIAGVRSSWISNVFAGLFIFRLSLDNCPATCSNVNFFGTSSKSEIWKDCFKNVLNDNPFSCFKMKHNNVAERCHKVIENQWTYPGDRIMMIWNYALKHFVFSKICLYQKEMGT